MRLSAILLGLAASAMAAEYKPPLTLEELGGPAFREQPDPTAHLFMLRSGMQQVAGEVDLLLNEVPYTLSDSAGNRLHAEGMLLVQPFQLRPGLTLGVGASRTYWSLGDDVGLMAMHLCALGGVVMPLTRDNDWRIDLVGFAGTGQATVGDDVVRSPAHEYGIDLGLTIPIVRKWRLEGGVSIGMYWSDIKAETFDVVKGGTVIPVTIDVDGKGYSYGVSLSWRP